MFKKAFDNFEYKICSLNVGKIDPMLPPTSSDVRKNRLNGGKVVNAFIFQTFSHSFCKEMAGKFDNEKHDKSFYETIKREC